MIESLGLFEAFRVLEYLPIRRGFIVLMVAGAVFPLVGVLVLRLNLITLRFTLMHAALLGSAIALAAGLNPLVAGIVANTVVVAAISRARSHATGDAGAITTFFMVVTVGLAFAVIYRFRVPATDALQILWGNIYAMTPVDAWLTVGFAIVVVAFVVMNFTAVSAVLFDRSVARSAGIREGIIYTTIILLVGLTVSFVMRLIGALLLDAILILPALMALSLAHSVRTTFLWAALFGMAVVFFGFALAILSDLPVSSGVTIFGAVLFLCVHAVTRHRLYRSTQRSLT